MTKHEKREKMGGKFENVILSGTQITGSAFFDWKGRKEREGIFGVFYRL